ncbi:hypothetical protein FIU97_09460 [Roseivivax sp. THAF40]|uniref:helix-turn-helix domain-containing protein n=1 Tax=Roseivivax sp. THAF40 TaxID=2587858 RepID=UPI001268BF30|nr:helix-turn-helix domain-containing protein [Roseivivax sp. THAF40]QFT46798.1 hypothetical protein FIU97_09460 [Roseivivax sp. THAF40]
MSYDLREIVELSKLPRGLSPLSKHLLMVMAGAARPPDFRCWLSKMELTARTGMDRKSVLRHLDRLTASGLIRYVGDKLINANLVDVFEFDLDALRTLNPVRDYHDRDALFSKLGGKGGELQGEGRRATGGGAENPSNQNKPVREPVLAEKEIETLLEQNDARLAAFVSEAISDPEMLAKAGLVIPFERRDHG